MTTEQPEVPDNKLSATSDALDKPPQAQPNTVVINHFHKGLIENFSLIKRVGSPTTISTKVQLGQTGKSKPEKPKWQQIFMAFITKRPVVAVLVVLCLVCIGDGGVILAHKYAHVNFQTVCLQGKQSLANATDTLR